MLSAQHVVQMNIITNTTANLQSLLSQGLTSQHSSKLPTQNPESRISCRIVLYAGQHRSAEHMSAAKLQHLHHHFSHCAAHSHHPLRKSCTSCSLRLLQQTKHTTSMNQELTGVSASYLQDTAHTKSTQTQKSCNIERQVTCSNQVPAFTLLVLCKKAQWHCANNAVTCALAWLRNHTHQQSTRPTLGHCKLKLIHKVRRLHV